jgi:hypothetical protein
MFHISNLISLFEIKQFKCGIIMRFMIIISALALADYAVSHVGFVKGGIKNGNRNLVSFFAVLLAAMLSKFSDN